MKSLLSLVVGQAGQRAHNAAGRFSQRTLRRVQFKTAFADELRFNVLIHL